MSVSLAIPGLADELALLLRATLLMGAAWAAATALRKAGASAAARHIAWLLGIAALLALPVLSYLVPALSLPILPAEAAPAMVPPPAVPVGPLGPDVPLDAGWRIALLAAYALGAAALLLRLIVGRLTLKRLWTDAGTVGDPAWEQLLSRLCAGMGLTRRVELRISRGPAVPMTWGTLAPKVLLPAEASEWPPERRRLVLLHELAHVTRRDSLSRSLASLACALYWFHPGAWFAARQMRMEQEHAADDRVLMAGGSAQAYALSLLHLARGAGAGPRLDEAAAMAGMYQLERRLVSIISPAPRNRPGAVFLSSSALLAGCTTFLVAAGVPVSATPTLPGPFQAKGTDGASSLERDTGSGRPERSSATESRAERISSPPAGSEIAADRLASEDAPASNSRSGGPASEAGDVAERRSPGLGGAVPGESGPTNPGTEPSRNMRQSSVTMEQLRNYDWELPRGDSRLQTGSRAPSSPPARITIPTTVYPASNDRIGPPKWAQKVPRLVRGRPPTGSAPSTQGPLVLSWSIGGK